MKRFVAVLGASAVAIGFSAAPAGADVHAFSQAACSGNPKAGATQSEDAIDNGRPAAPIPISASPSKDLTNFPAHWLENPIDPGCDVPAGN